MYIEHATGTPTVDHMLPKSLMPRTLAYEWTNYRLCAASINAAKRDALDIVDPFECRPGWFALELTGFQVVRGSKAPTDQDDRLERTLKLLNRDDCCKARAEYVQCYQNRDITLRHLECRAPFIARELRRQRRLHQEDRRPPARDRSAARGEKRGRR